MIELSSFLHHVHSFQKLKFLLFSLASNSKSGVKHFGFFALKIFASLFVKFDFLQNLMLLMLIGSGNSVDILQTIFSLNHFNFLLNERFVLSPLILLLLLNFFLLSVTNEDINLFLTLFIHNFSDPFLVLFTLNILLLLNCDLSFLFSGEYFLSFICFSHWLKHFIFLHELDVFGVFEYLFHFCLFFFGLQFDLLLF